MARYPRTEVRSSCGGHGVFAVEPIAARSRILRFGGAALDALAIDSAARGGGHDDYLQIGEGLYLGQSGTADDFINHACAPNTFVRVTTRGVYLVALDDIAADAELTFDYGVTQVGFPFRFRCLCGAADCRGEIGNYDEIPPAVMARYRAAGAIPPHVATRLFGRVERSARRSRARAAHEHEAEIVGLAGCTGRDLQHA
ncbi:MAG: SET domain-containing protein-lysine N-methyltransferase [Gammaproteobacteria bacterium]